MQEIRGKKQTALCFASVIEDEAVRQIRDVLDSPAAEGSKIRIMPDAHAGKGCVIGTTMTLTDKVVAGFITRKAVLIVSEQSAMISEGIIHEMGRGVTFLHAEGAFLHRAEKVIFVVVTLTQIAKLKSIAYRYDPTAFMIVVDANEVMGRGFTIPLVKIEEMVRKRDEEIKSKAGK